MFILGLSFYIYLHVLTEFSEDLRNLRLSVKVPLPHMLRRHPVGKQLSRKGLEGLGGHEVEHEAANVSLPQRRPVVS